MLSHPARRSRHAISRPANTRPQLPPPSPWSLQERRQEQARLLKAKMAEKVGAGHCCDCSCGRRRTPPPPPPPLASSSSSLLLRYRRSVLARSWRSRQPSWPRRRWVVGWFVHMPSGHHPPPHHFPLALIAALIAALQAARKAARLSGGSPGSAAPKKRWAVLRFNWMPFKRTLTLLIAPVTLTMSSSIPTSGAKKGLSAESERGY